MVRHGEYVKSVERPEWSGFMVDYNGIKKRMETVAAAGQKGDINEHETVEVTKGIMRDVELEIEKCAAQYESMLKQCVFQVSSVNGRWDYLSPQTFGRMYADCKEAGDILTSSILFLEINAESARKLLKKAEKLLRPLGVRDVEEKEILKELLRPDNFSSRFDKLRLYHDTLKLADEITNLIAAIRAFENAWINERQMSVSEAQAVHREDTEIKLRDMHNQIISALDKTRWYYGLMNLAKVDYEGDALGESNRFGIVTSIMATVLYLMNYYIVIPTASQYSEYVGLKKSASGLLLAAAPLGSLISQVVYIKWSDKSFKWPLVAGATCLVVGNLLYGLAYDATDAWMLFFGRLLVGLGGNRAINRRYVSDFVDVDKRSVWSAIYVGAGACGMALGPALQPLLSLIPHDYRAPWLFGAAFNPLNAGGWIMMILWILFEISTLVFFVEPIRRPAKSQPHPIIMPWLKTDPGTATTSDVPLRITSQNLSLPPVGPPGTIGSKIKLEGNDTPQTELGQMGMGSRESLKKSLSRAKTGGEGSSDNLKADSRWDSATPTHEMMKETTTEGVRAAQVATMGPRGTAAEEALRKGRKERLMDTLKKWGMAMTRGSWICFWIFFVEKVIQESLQSTCPIVTEVAFGWTDSDVGYLLLLVGILVIPLSFFYGWVSRYLNDRVVQIVALCGLVLGPLMTLVFGFTSDDSSSNETQGFGLKVVRSATYIIGITLSFSFVQLLEAANTALMSKTMNKAYCSGLLTAGFLSTEIGTLGRVVGNIWLSIGGAILGDDGTGDARKAAFALQAFSSVPSMIIAAGTIALCAANWKYMMPRQYLLNKQLTLAQGV